MGAPKTTRPWSPERLLREHGDALYDCALAVTGDVDRAVAAVREAVASVDGDGPAVDRARVLGAVFASAVPVAVPPPLVSHDLLRAGPGSPDELQRVAREATLLLDPVQRGCLDLALRQNLEGGDLSEALGVTPGLASVSVQAATEQAEHIIGAVLLARVGRADCPGLDEIALEAVGAPAEKLAAAVVEHGDACAACSDRNRALVQVTTLLANVPPVPAPAVLRKVPPHRRRGVGRVRRPGPIPAPRGLAARARRRRRAWVAVGGVAVLVGTLAAVLWPDHGGEIAPAAAPGGQLVVDATAVDFGSDAVQAGLRITNSGREPLVFETRSAAPWISFVGGEGTIDPGASVEVSAVLDRSRAPEGAADSEIRVRSNGGSATVPVRALVERAPQVSGLQAVPQMVVVRRCPGATPAQVRAVVVEESGIADVQLHWARPGRPEQVSPMTGDAKSSYLGALGPFDTPGDVRWWITATDIRNNRSASPPQVLRVGSC